MPPTPTLNFVTDPVTVGAIISSTGETTKHKSPTRLGQDFLPRPSGRHAPCLTFSNGLTCTASQAGCNAASSATATPLPSASASSPKVKSPRARSITEKRFPTVSPTATSAARANSQPTNAPITEPASARSKASARISRSNSLRFMPIQRKAPISFLRWMTETATVL